jgi:hypothetical protein
LLDRLRFEETMMICVWRTALVASLLGCGIAACSSSASVSPYGYGGGDIGTTELEDAGDGGGGITGDGGPSPMPMLAEIDPGATMVQTPGEGVGVFTQYSPSTASDPGGHWYIWWTCDTDKSDESCPFSIEVSVAKGAISKVTTDGGAQNDASITAQTTTTTTVQGVRFDTDPGAVITLSAALSGEYSGSFLFFVQDALVNGGYMGTLTDPLELQSTSP